MPRTRRCARRSRRWRSGPRCFACSAPIRAPYSEGMAAAGHPGELAVPAVRALSPYQPGKPISELERELGLRDIIKLASNENPYGPSPVTRAALRAALEDVWLYPDGS